MATNVETVSSEREDDTALLGNLTGAFGQALDMGPGLLQVQRSLLAGLAHSQLTEAKRLTRRLDKSHPRVRSAMARADAFGQLNDDVTSGVQQAERVAQTAFEDHVFWGYVRLANGEGAPKLEVRLQLHQDLKKDDVFKGPTDDKGFFRIPLPVDAFSAHAETHSNASGLDTAEVGANLGNSRVTVHDEKGQQVFRDPTPPSFEGSTTEMRLYSLDLDANSIR